MNVSLCQYACVLMLKSICPYDDVHVSLCLHVCVLMNKNTKNKKGNKKTKKNKNKKVICPYTCMIVSSCLSACVLMPSCLCPHKKTKKNKNGGDNDEEEAETPEERIKVGRKVRKIVNRRIHKKACLFFYMCVLIIHCMCPCAYKHVSSN